MKKDNPNDFELSKNTDVEEPELEFWEVEFVEIFYRLTSSRASSMGVGAIPLSEIITYADFFNIPDPLDFIKIIQEADSAYLDEYNKAQDAKTKKEH